MNSDNLVSALTIIAIVGAGLNAGIYFSYSTFTMAALRRLPASRGAAAMQAVNIEAPTPPFMSIFFGTGLLSTAIGLLALADLGVPGAPLRLAGAAFYLASIVITVAFNVPLNDGLARVDPESASGVATWASYQGRWTRDNHLRTLVSAAAVVFLGLSLVAG